MKKSVAEIRQIAEAAITAGYAEAEAKKALEADPENESLKTAYDTAKTATVDAKAKADALSQDDGGDENKSKADKIKKKMQYLRRDLQALGVSDDDDDTEADDSDLDLEINPDKPLTYADLQRIEAKKAASASSDMANAIEDPLARQAVKEALAGLKLSGNPEADYRRALTIANAEKNSKVLEELMRKPTPLQHRSGAGAPPRSVQQNDQDIELTSEEKSFMRPPFNLTREAVIAARKANDAQKR